MTTENLKALRELRIQEKAIKARIDEISGKATEEAVAILAKKGFSAAAKGGAKYIFSQISCYRYKSTYPCGP